MPDVPVKNRRHLREILQENLITETEVEDRVPAEEEDTEEARKRTKSQILEANVSFEDYVVSTRGAFEFIRSDDSTLWNIVFHGALAGYLDIANPRLWILHSIGAALEMNDNVRNMTEKDNSMIDLPWLSSNSLERIGAFGKTSAGFSLRYRNRFLETGAESDVEDMTMRFWGSAALELIDQLKKNKRIEGGLSLNGIGLIHEFENGYVKEQVSSSGRIMAMRGDSIDSHFSVLSKVQTYYQNLLNVLESEYRFSYKPLPHGVAFSGEALKIVFQRRIGNLRDFIDNMFSTIQPFRLWGVTKELEPDRMKVKAVDLHSGGRIDFEIEPTQMTIYLQAETCANVVARLFTNLQSTFDARSQLIGYDQPIM